jgi:integration host factor subunit alpha
MTALTKSEMAERLYEELGLNKREAKEIVELFFEEIRECLEGNEQVKLSGFGNFDLRDKSQRPGRNPKTGEEIPISARRVVTFRPGQKLKARVESYGEEGAAEEVDSHEGYDSYDARSEPSPYGVRSYDGGSEQ